MGHHPVPRRTRIGLLERRKQMGRPLRTAETVGGTAKTGVIGPDAAAGEQIRFTGFVTAGSANNSVLLYKKEHDVFVLLQQMVQKH